MSLLAEYRERGYIEMPGIPAQVAHSGVFGCAPVMASTPVLSSFPAFRLPEPAAPAVSVSLRAGYRVVYEVPDDVQAISVRWERGDDDGVIVVIRPAILDA